MGWIFYNIERDEHGRVPVKKAKSAKWVDPVKYKYFASTFVAKTDYTIVKKGK